MRLRTGLPRPVGPWLGLAIVGALAAAAPAPAPLPPGRQHRLSIEGENTITFLARAGLPAMKTDYRARVEYLVDTRLGKGPGPAVDGPEGPGADAEGPAEGPPGAKSKSKAKAKAKARAKAPAAKATGAVDLALHSIEAAYRQDGRTVVETRMSRARFQGRLQPEAPVLNVAAKEAPPRLQEILGAFDATIASLLVDDDGKVVGLRIKGEGPQRALAETLASIHAPAPRGRDSWDAPSRLAMGHGQTARGVLRFAMVKATAAGAVDAAGAGPGPAGVVRVKVSGVLRGEGVVAGNFLKEGTYTVDGEQSYDPRSREWVASRWSVEVDNELANPAGLTVAKVRGRMVVESRAVDGPAAPGPAPAAPKP